MSNSNNSVGLRTISEAIGWLIRICLGTGNQSEAIGKLRSSGEWTSIEQEFHDNWAKSISNDQVEPEILFNSPTAIEFRFARESLGDLQGKRVLDLGCGAGEASVFFAMQNARVVAVDVSPRMAERTRQLARQYGVLDQIEVLVASGCNLPLDDRSFDLVFGSSVLHHVDLRRASREIARVSKHLGRAVFIEPLGYNPMIEVYRFMANEVRTPTERPLVFDDIQKLENVFARVGHSEFHLFTLGIFLWFFLVERIHPNQDRYWKRFVRNGAQYARGFRFLHALDRFVLGNMPSLRKWCWVVVIECDNYH